MRGGTSTPVMVITLALGLSPRARGNLVDRSVHVVAVGTIPACAGEPADGCQVATASGDYPRVRGGTSMARARTVAKSGLSPRARGNPARRAQPGLPSGTIPACAGEPRAYCSCSAMAWDYPRVRGGTIVMGSYGESWPGLSPRARGNPQCAHRSDPLRRTIPACAGEPEFRVLLRVREGDYPRVRGGTNSRIGARPASQGLSPRARGNPESGGCLVGGLGTIPACAGEPQTFRNQLFIERDYPRVRGGT